jgi:signal peptidase I
MNENLQEVVTENIPVSPAPARPSPWRTALAMGRELVVTILPAVVMALLIQFFLAQSTIVFGQSMEPNLHQDQRLVVEKVSYRWHGPQRGDIVVLPDPSGGPIPLIKRVVGLPGERVNIAAGRVYVDGAALDEPYLAQITTGEGRSWQVPPMQVFVMGDNRGDSRDSRYFGPVSIETLVGHAVFRLWPLDKFGIVH